MLLSLQVGYPLVTVLVCLVDASNYSSLVDSMADFLTKQMKNKEYRSVGTGSLCVMQAHYAFPVYASKGYSVDCRVQFVENMADFLAKQMKNKEYRSVGTDSTCCTCQFPVCALMQYS
jgi:hypothetical protein